MIDDLLRQIADAFHAVPVPSDITRSVARALNNEWNVPEPRRSELRLSDHETCWLDVSDKAIEDFDDSIWFLDAEGYHFYMPAFVSYVLRRHRDSASSVIDCTISACKDQPEKFSLFSAAQMRCVIDFLTFCAHAEEDSNLDATTAAAAIYWFEHPRPLQQA